MLGSHTIIYLTWSTWSTWHEHWGTYWSRKDILWRSVFSKTLLSHWRDWFWVSRGTTPEKIEAEQEMIEVEAFEKFMNPPEYQEIITITPTWLRKIHEVLIETNTLYPITHKIWVIFSMSTKWWQTRNIKFCKKFSSTRNSKSQESWYMHKKHYCHGKQQSSKFSGESTCDSTNKM